MNLNKVEIAGGLTRDPEVKVFDSGSVLCEFTLAVNGARYDSKARQQVVTTEFLAVQAWGWLADQVADMGLSKGDAVYVMGQVTQREVEKKDGTKEKKTRIAAASVVPIRKRGGAPQQRAVSNAWDQDGEQPPPF